MAIPTRPVAGAVIATAWGQYVHDRALLFLGRGCVATSLTADSLSLATGIVFQRHSYTGTDKWDIDGMHSTVVNPYTINLPTAGLWAVYGSYQVACGATEHNHYAGISYGGGLGSAPLAKDQRALRAVVSVTNRFEFGPWWLVDGGAGGTNVEFWIASGHTSGTETADGAINGSGEFAAFLIQPNA